MIFNFIIAIGAGYAARMLYQLLGKHLSGRYAMDAQDLRLCAFILAMLAAVIFLAVGGIERHSFALILGGGIGTFYDYLLRLAKDEYETRKDKKLD